MKTFAELGRVFTQKQKEQSPHIPERLVNKPFFKDTQNGVFGVYKPTPVDRSAAMMLATSRWKNAPENKKENTMSVSVSDVNRVVRGDSDEKLCRKVNGESCFNMDELALRVAEKIEAGLPNKLSKLAKYVCDSRDAMMAACDNIGGVMDEFDRRVSSAMDTVRSKRMTIVSEASLATNALKDVRQFFMGKDYEQETKRLSEFVELCERLQKLKDSGFLDVVADTMIRLDR